MAEMATISPNGANGALDEQRTPAPGAAAPPAAPQEATPSLTAELIAQSLAEGRGWLAERRARAAHQPSDPVALRAWLLRASFTLFALTVLSVVLLSGLNLLSTAEIVAVLSPVMTLTALIVGVFLGDRSGG